MNKKKPRTYDEDWFPESNILGVGAYQYTGVKPSVSKLKNPIGFIRPKMKQPVRAATKRSVK
jgi:hypothetical protein